MGDHIHNTHGPKRWGLLCHFRGELGSRLIQCSLGQGLLPYQVASSFIQPSGHNKRGPKIEWGGYALFSGDSWVPIEHRSHLSRGLPPYLAVLVHTVVWPQRTLAENWGSAPFLGRGAGSPSSTMRPGLRPTSMPSSILIHQGVWPQ